MELNTNNSLSNYTSDDRKYNMNVGVFNGNVSLGFFSTDTKSRLDSINLNDVQHNTLVKHIYQVLENKKPGYGLGIQLYKTERTPEGKFNQVHCYGIYVGMSDEGIYYLHAKFMKSSVGVKILFKGDRNTELTSNPLTDQERSTLAFETFYNLMKEQVTAAKVLSKLTMTKNSFKKDEKPNNTKNSNFSDDNFDSF